MLEEFKVGNKVACPVCNALLNMATSVTGNVAPEPGDFSVCVFCAAILRFEEGLKYVEAKTEDLSLLDEESKAVLLKAHQYFKAKPIR